MATRSGSKEAGDALRAWRTAQKDSVTGKSMTLAAAGRLVGVEHTTWSQIESGARNPSLELALDIERVSGVRMELWGFAADLVAKMRNVLARRDIAEFAEPAKAAS
jgi:DNA-binding XRE family transcriptional regulator